MLHELFQERGPPAEGKAALVCTLQIRPDLKRKALQRSADAVKQDIIVAVDYYRSSIVIVDVSDIPSSRSSLLPCLGFCDVENASG